MPVSSFTSVFFAKTFNKLFNPTDMMINVMLNNLLERFSKLSEKLGNKDSNISGTNNKTNVLSGTNNKRKILSDYLSNNNDYKFKNQKIDPKYKNVSEKVKNTVKNVAQAEGLDPNLLMAVIKTESNFNPRAKSSAQCKGLMQLKDSTAAEVAEELGMGQNFDVYDIETNIRLGARYLKKMLKKFNGNVKLALAAYNAGPNAVKKYGGVPPYKETQNYVVGS